MSIRFTMLAMTAALFAGAVATTVTVIPAFRCARRRWRWRRGVAAEWRTWRRR